MKTTLDEVENFFVECVRKTVRYREENDVTRKDFMDLLIKIKNGKKLSDSDGETLSGLSMNEVTANAFVYFLAGFETSSTTMTFALYELALNEDVQRRAREEIKRVLDRHGGELSYEAVMDMTYITQILNGEFVSYTSSRTICIKIFRSNILESLRKYSPVGNLKRKSNRDYNVPNTKFVIPKGTRVLIPVHAVTLETPR